MTRETKIGLLVGLAFIIVIGILLSDHFASTMQPPQTALISATGEAVRQSTTTPGLGMAGVSDVRVDVNPDRVVHFPGQGGHVRAHVSVGPSANQHSNPEAVQVPGNVFGGAENVLGNPNPGERGSIGDVGPRSVWESAQGSNPGLGSQVQDGNQTAYTGNVDQTPVAKSVREYTAEPGDTLWKIAAKTLGKSTKANRDAIIQLNPELQKDPSRIRAGATYYIPLSVAEATRVSEPEASGESSQPVRATSGETIYTTKVGDSLWKIAVEQVGSPSALAQIRELNRDVLKNGDAIKPNMKLRLPPRAVASAE